MKNSTPELRQAFIRYFEQHGHQAVPSSALIPQADPTLLFTNAGMNQFKRVFLGEETRAYKRAVTVQKCLRAGGKHNDLENVGYTRRHHTFFEMLGNFSFGDYFKEDAITFGWEFLTQTVGLAKDRMWVTIFRDDDSADRLWKKVGVPASRIMRCDEKDNFWQMGGPDPVGPARNFISTRDRRYRATIGRTARAIASSRSGISSSCSSIGMLRGSCIPSQAQHRYGHGIGTVGGSGTRRLQQL